MKKQFPLQSPSKARERVVDAVKHDVRKYVKRERNKTVPEGFNQWEFDCRVGLDSSHAEARSLAEVSAAIDAIATTGADAVYVEILSRPALRVASPRAPTDQIPTADPAET